ncbi:MAG: FUSC family protein [Terracidiphilus sp.]
MSAPNAGVTAPVPYLKDSTVFQWENQTLRGDLIITLPIALCLGVGIAVGHPAAGMIAAGGAANTGFGQKHYIDNSYLLPMIFVTFGMAFSGFLGVLLGHENLLLVLVSALWAFGYGMLTARPDGYSWVGQQCVITLMVTSAFPAPLRAAADRGLLLFAGGALELVVSSLLLQMFSDLRMRLFDLTRYLRAEETALRVALTETAASVRQLRFAHSALPYSIRLALTIALATEIYRRLHYPSGYWIPMTALLVLKPDLTDTVSRAIARTLGTMCGAIAVSFCLAHLHPTPVVLAAFTVLFAWLAYGLLNVNYALFSTAVTGYIVFLLALDQVPGRLIAEHRTFCTALGGGIALVMRVIVISYRRRHWLRALAVVRHAVRPNHAGRPGRGASPLQS